MPSGEARLYLPVTPKKGLALPLVIGNPEPGSPKRSPLQRLLDALLERVLPLVLARRLENSRDLVIREQALAPFAAAAAATGALEAAGRGGQDAGQDGRVAHVLLVGAPERVQQVVPRRHVRLARVRGPDVVQRPQGVLRPGKGEQVLGQGDLGEPGRLLAPVRVVEAVLALGGHGEGRLIAWNCRVSSDIL